MGEIRDWMSLKVGDVVWESSQYGEMEITINTKPKRVEKDGMVQFKFTAKDKDNRVVDYMKTEGLEHYGPSLYTERQYYSPKELQEALNDTRPT